MSALLDRISAQRRRHRQRVAERQRATRSGGGFDPTSISAVSAWLRNDTLSGNISSVTDVLNSNPAVQAVDDRRPEGAADGSMTFLTNDVLSWPLVASNNGSSKWGCALWVECDGVGVNETLVAINLITGSATARKLVLTKTNGNRLNFDIYITDANGRRFSTTGDFIETTKAFVTAEIDTTKATEEAQIKITINGVVQIWSSSNIGAGGTLSGLVVPTGNMLIGNGRDGGANAPFQGRMGRSSLFFGSAMPAATAGLLTAQAIADLMSFEPLV